MSTVKAVSLVLDFFTIRDILTFCHCHQDFWTRFHLSADKGERSPVRLVVNMVRKSSPKSLLAYYIGIYIQITSYLKYEAGLAPVHSNEHRTRDRCVVGCESALAPWWVT